MSIPLHRIFFAAVVSMALLFTGCQDDVIHTSGHCPDDECVSCDGPGDCDDDTYCHPEDGVCAVMQCEPNATHCDGDSVVRCDDVGSGYLEPTSCDSGVCTEGQCGCNTDNQCGDGEECVDGLCECEACGPEGICCDDGHSCESVEICEDGSCEFVSLCRAECDGSFCGATGDICCDGSTPECGPTGQCAPTCEGQGELCGDDFDECCPAGDYCVFGECRTPGTDCDTLWDCDFGEYCDQGLGKCMADDYPDDIECRIDGDFQELEIAEKWSWTDQDIISIPVVGDVTGDGEPNVVINSTRDGANDWMRGRIFILDSAGNEILRVEHDPANDSWGSMGRSNIALADITGDGVSEIIYASRTVTGSNSYIVAINGDGETLWVAHNEAGTPIHGTVQNGAITAANFDDDPDRAEILVGAMLIDSDGLVVWNENGNGPLFGSNSGYTGGVAVAADLTGDGNHDIVTGRNAWEVDWQPGAQAGDPPNVTVTELWNHIGSDGYPAVADMNGNGEPEVVLVGARTVRVLDGTTGELLCAVDDTGQACEDDDSLRLQPIYLPGPTNDNRGGPPTVADFDGDGRPEIGVAGGHYYAVFDINRPGFGADSSPEEIDTDLLDEFTQPEPEVGEFYIRWMRATRDYSSNSTGSSVFDFQGDGSASVIYSDECFMRVYSGINGDVELEIMNSTGTILEYPLVVDVDGNGRSEILVVSNDIDHCSGFVDDYETRQGLYVYEDPNDRWVRTRSIWNQHAYSIDNILDDGTVPATQNASWASHNTFRANRQGEVPLNAADVVVTEVLINSTTCPPDLNLQVTIQNQGISAIPAGLPISLYNVDGDDHLLTTTMDEPLSPGGTRTVQITYEVPSNLFNTPLNLMVIANDDGSADPAVYDCNPDNASAMVDTVECVFQL